MEIEIEGILTPEEQDLIKGLDLNELEELQNEQEKFDKMHEARFTASTAYRLMGYEDSAEFPKGAQTYVIEKVLESETVNERKQINTFSVLHGKETEVEAVEEYMKATGKVVTKYGKEQQFIEKGKHEGCTPDGLIGDEEGLEVKCPDSKTHYERLRFLTAETIKKMLPEYYWQMQDCMRITGRKRWNFVDYDKRFKNPSKRLLIIVVERNEEDIKKLARRTYTAVKEYKKQVEILRN
jgi:hypothetical protein